MSSTIPNEQPMSKRQRIDSLVIVADGRIGDGSNATAQRAFAVIANGSATGADINKDNLNSSNNSANIVPPPDILPTISYGPMSANMLNSTAMAANDLDEMDNAPAAAHHMLRCMDTAFNSTSKSNGEFPDLLKTTSGAVAIASTSNHIVLATSGTSNASTVSPSCSSNSETSHRTNHRTSASANNLDEFQLHLMTQCLCDISDSVLSHPFDMGVKRRVPLSEWPAHKVIEFLSNIQFLFDVYLKQNAKGQICMRIMQVCDALVCDKQNIIGDIFNLHEYNNKYVRFLAGRVMASCMVIAKDKKELYDNWLTTLVGNLVIDHNHGEYGALRKITFSLEIILRILEWRDKEQHPLEDKLDGRSMVDSDEQITVPVIVPPIENNYFAMHYNSDAAASSITTPMMSSSHMRETSPPLTPPVPSTLTAAATRTSAIPNANCDSTTSTTSKRPDTTCHLQTLSDSESFDTKDLKCNIVNALKNEWSNLVDSMGDCISVLHRNHRHFEYAENTILTFLTVWEHIISVKANISFDTTLPFHEKLTTFERILISGNLSVAIYKQILTLFNESMCYGTTLALQSDSELPEETTRLANEIFNSVKSQRIFNSLPVQQGMPENEIGFIGYKRPTIEYPVHYRQKAFANGRDSGDDDDVDDDDDDDDDDSTLFTTEQFLLNSCNQSQQSLRHSNAQTNGLVNTIDEHKSNDRILLQKLVLLILKAIAVTVKPVRGDDSSDSSMDGSNSNSSTDYEVYQNTIQIERATRDVLKKLIEFMKHKLNHHPETHFSKMVAHLFSDQDDYLIEAMICIVDTTTAFLPPRHPLAVGDRDQFQTLINMLNPVYSFLELLELISFKSEVLLDFLISEETCFLFYLIRFLKYIRSDWNTFQSHCDDYWLSPDNGRTGIRGARDDSLSVLTRAMETLTKLRVQIDKLVIQAVFPYLISPVLELLRQCEEYYDGPL